MSKKNRNQSKPNQTEQDQLKEKIRKANTEIYLHARGHAALALKSLHGDKFDSEIAFDRLTRSVDRVLNNDTTEIEAMLITQAKSLEYVFYDALTKLPNSSIENADVFASIAFKAQAGCRKTLMALSELKHPRRITNIIKQQNNALNQQVNNSVTSEDHSIENNKKIANGLNAKVSYEAKKMDFGTTATTSSTNTPAETVGVLNWPKNSRR